MRTRAAGESALLLLDAVAVLSRLRLDYAVIGALAASIHGAVRASLDADVVLSAPVQQAENLQRSFEAEGLRAELTRGGFDDPIAGLIKIEDIYGNRVDVLLGLRGVAPEAFSRTIEVPFQGETLRFIGREDFIAMKLYAGGPVDLLDARRAVTAAGGSLDRPLLESLARRYGREAEAALKRLLAT